MTNRIDLIKASLTENDHLIERVQELSLERRSLFEEEWKRRANYFPDLHLAALEQMMIIVQPPKPKTTTAAVPKKP